MRRKKELTEEKEKQYRESQSKNIYKNLISCCLFYKMEQDFKKRREKKLPEGFDFKKQQQADNPKLPAIWYGAIFTFINMH